MARAAGRPVPELLAAVDLGSNSFHLVVARYAHGQISVVDRLKEMVRLGSGLSPDGRLDRDVAARAIACLERFGQRLRDMRPGSVRAVGTNALRRAHRKQAFLERAREALGHPIEIVSGVEEARLIYSGVAHTMPASPGRRLVIDIGGGSTELIIGEALEPLELESTQMGCVSTTEEFFPDGRITGKRLARARLAARQELEPIQDRFRRRGWDEIVGSSGTVRAIRDAIHDLDPRLQSVTPEGLERLIDVLLAAERIEEVELESLDAERRPVFVGGVAILAELFEVLGLERMDAAEGAMRDGILYDMVGRFTDEDARERTVRAMQSRYHVDLGQAERVEKTVLGFLAQVDGAWGLDDPLAEKLLSWAARLHEIGLDVSHSKYHQHGAYLLENSDMQGFPREEQRVLAQLVRFHRRKIDTSGFEQLIPPWDRRIPRLIALLRLAVLLRRGRSDAALPELRLATRGDTLELRFPSQWLREHPLTAADLTQEEELLRSVGLRLRVFSSRS